MRIFAYNVLIEETDCLFAGRCREANQERIEVLEHLSPQIVDRTVTFICDDEVECFDRNRGIIFNLANPVISGSQFKAGALIEIFGELLTAKHRIQALNCRDRYARDGINAIGSEVLSVVNLRKFTSI